MVVGGEVRGGARSLGHRERQEVGIPIAAELEPAAVLYHAVQHQRALEVEPHVLSGALHPVGDSVPAVEAAVPGAHPYVQVIEADVPPRPLGGVGAAHAVGVAGRLGVSALGEAQAGRAKEQGSKAGEGSHEVGG